MPGQRQRLLPLSRLHGPAHAHRATCASYQAGTAEDLPSSEINYVLRDNIITSIAPGVFFYWSKVVAPSANFTIQIVQERSNPNFPYCGIQQEQIALYDADCNRLADGVETSPGQAAMNVRGARVGQVPIVNVKYSLKPLVGTYLDPNNGVHYAFRTVINGQVVDSDPDGLRLAPLP